MSRIAWFRQALRFYVSAQFLFNVVSFLILLATAPFGGAALLGHFFAMIGLVSPFVLLVSLPGITPSTAGLVNFTVIALAAGPVLTSRSGNPVTVFRAAVQTVQSIRRSPRAKS